MAYLGLPHPYYNDEFSCTRHALRRFGTCFLLLPVFCKWNGSNGPVLPSEGDTRVKGRFALGEPSNATSKPSLKALPNLKSSGHDSKSDKLQATVRTVEHCAGAAGATHLVNSPPIPYFSGASCPHAASG